MNFGCCFCDQGGITIGNDVKFGPFVKILTTNHPLDPNDRTTLISDHVVIKDNAWIGANTTILPGITIGRNSVVGAGSVVTKDVPDNVAVAGNPARKIRDL
ncbi:MAG: DapH/DapD/GlmU-related protein [Candidatus Methanomethylophilaceae archaeon]